MIKSIELVKGVGPKIKSILNQEGIYSTYDLILYVPKNYENFSVQSIHDLQHDKVVTIKGIVSSNIENIKKKVLMSKFKLNVEKNEITVITFNRRYLQKSISIGKEILVKGKYNVFKNEIVASNITTIIDTPEIKPIYGILGIPDSKIHAIIEEIYKEKLVDIYNLVPDELIHKYHMLDRSKVYQLLHFPKSNHDIFLARETLKKEEAFFHLLKYNIERIPRYKRDPIPYDINLVKSYIEKLPFELTHDQKHATNDIFKDFKFNQQMYRLIQGDVGSGKTIVSFIAALGALSAGYQVAFMAPTEILIQQHYESFKEIFNDINTACLTSNSKNKEDIIENVKNGSIKMIFGTHILSNPVVEYKKLGLVIIDEQHKFGVEQRENLIKKSLTKDTIYLTATPIPRSLALTFFNELDISSIKEKPSERKSVLTKIIHQNDFDFIINLIKENQALLNQTLIVAPQIEKSENLYSVLELYEKFKDEFNDHLYVVHGKLHDDEIQRTFNDFIKDEKGILISTTIIEVGMNLKDATLLFIMDAHQFGLSTLHQLRGRIGRGSKSGICYLVSDKDSERLQYLKDNYDGFKLSEYDLKLRGPGIFSNMIQTGFQGFKYLDLTNDFNLLKSMHEDVLYYAQNIEKFPRLKKEIAYKMV